MIPLSQASRFVDLKYVIVFFKYPPQQKKKKEKKRGNSWCQMTAATEELVPN